MKKLMLAVAVLVSAGSAFAEAGAGYTPQNIAALAGAGAAGGLHAAGVAAATAPAAPTYDRGARLFQYVSACMQDRLAAGAPSGSSLNDIIRNSLSKSNF